MKKQFSFLKTSLSLLVVLLSLFLCSGTTDAQYLDNLSDAWSQAPTAAYSTRKVMSGYSGAAMKLRRSNDSQEVDVYFDNTGWVSMDSKVSASGGGVATTTSLSTWINETVANQSAYVVTWYDQSGGGKHATSVLCTGTISASGTTTVTGSGTLFSTELSAGTKIYRQDTGAYLTTVSTNPSSATSFTASGAVTITAGTAFYSKDQQPRFINAGVIQTMPNGRPALYMLNGSNKGTANGLVTPMTLSADANVNVFAVAERMAQSSEVNGMIIGNLACYNTASSTNFSAGYATTTTLGLRSTLYASASPTVLKQSYAMQYYANALKTTTTNENSNIVQLDSLGNTTTGTAITGAITFTATGKLSLFRPLGYSNRSFNGYCPEVIYYASTTADQEFNSADATTWLANQRYNYLQMPVINAPTDITATSLTVNWTNGDLNLGTIGTDYNYRIQYSSSINFTSPTEVVVSSGTSPFSYNISGLTAGTTYYVRLRIEATNFTYGWSAPLLFGKVKVGPGQAYTKIQTAYDSGISSTIYTPVIIELQSDYDPTTETYPITFGAKAGVSATNTITIKPATGAKITLANPLATKTLTGAALTNATEATFTLPDVTGLSTSSYISGIGTYTGGEFKKLSAVNGTTKAVTVPAAAVTASKPSTTLFFGPANTKTIYFDGADYVVIDGVSTTDGSTGLTIQNPNPIYSNTIYFNSGTNNTVRNCFIKGTNQTGSWNNGYCGQIFFNGGSYNTVTQNEICDIDGYPLPICLVTFNNGPSNNTVSYNNMYNVGTELSPNGNGGFFQFPSSLSGNNNNVLNNKMYWTKAAIFTRDIYLVGAGGSMTGIGHRIENNVIGYETSNGTGTATLSAVSGLTTLILTGITPKNATVVNNIIGGINASCKSFYGIQNLAHSATSTATGDTYCYGNQIKDIAVSTTATGAFIMGIEANISTPLDLNIKNNIIKNLTCTSTVAANTCTVLGITTTGTGSASNVSNFSGNQVYNLTAGLSGTTGSSTANLCYGLKIGGTNARLVEKNLVYKLVTPNTNGSIRGIEIVGSNATGTTFQNNVIRLGSDVTTYGFINAFYQNTATTASHPMYFYHNSVYIGGTSSGSSTSTVFNRYTTNNPSLTFKNNIFSNKRSGSGIVNQIYVLNTLASIVSSDNNLYEYVGQFAQESSPSAVNYTALSNWNAARTTATLSTDGSIDQTSPQFMDATASTPDLTIDAAYAMADAKGADLSAVVTDDYSGTARSGLTPSDLGAYAYTSTATKPTVSISTTAVSSNAVSPLPITFTFSTAVTGFTLSDIVVGNGSAANLATSNNITFTAEVTPTNAANPVTIDVADGAAYDAIYYANNTAATQLFIKGTSTITTTGTTSFTYTGSAQGPATSDKTGSTGAVTYEYVGVNGTSYGPSATAPSAVGSYTVTASVAADANYNAATSDALAFTIAAVVPGAPTSAIATAGEVSASVAFTVPANNGGSAITGYTVTSTPGNFTGTGASSPITVSGLANGYAYTFAVTATNSAGTGAASAASNSITPVGNNIEITTTTNVSALSLTTSSDLVVSSGKLTINAAKQVHSITVAPGAQLELSSGNTLNATSGVTLQSDATGTATLVDNTTTAPQAVSGTVQQRFVMTTARNWYLSTPTATATVPTGKTYYSYVEAGTNNDLSASGSAYWKPEAAGNSLNPAKGYIAPISSTSTLEFTGTFNTGEYTVALTRTPGKLKEGFNLVANPYPSYLDWSVVDTTTAKIMTSVWYRTKTSGDAYTFDTYNGKLDVATSNGANLVSKLIPPMQAFWVRIKAAETAGTLTFTNAMRRHSDNSSNKFKVVSNKATDTKLVRLKVSNAKNSDETILCFNDNASDNFDSYDSPKWFNSTASIPEIYTQVGTEKLVINGLKELKTNIEIPLGFVAGEASAFTIAATQLKNLDSDVRVALIDKQKNVEFELNENVAYHFNSEIVGASTDRFSLIFRTAGSTTDVRNANSLNAQVLVNAANQITIIAPVKNNYVIYNAMGQLIENGIVNSNLQTVKTKLNTGVYVVKVGNESSKVIVK